MQPALGRRRHRRSNTPTSFGQPGLRCRLLRAILSSQRWKCLAASFAWHPVMRVILPLLEFIAGGPPVWSPWVSSPQVRSLRTDWSTTVIWQWPMSRAPQRTGWLRRVKNRPCRIWTGVGLCTPHRPVRLIV